MKTLGDFIPHDCIPDRPGDPTANSPAMCWSGVVIAEGTTRFHFFHRWTGRCFPLTEMPLDLTSRLCERFVSYLNSAAEQED